MSSLEERYRDWGEYMVSHKCTVRQAAQEKGVGKSTMYTALTKYLPTYDTKLAQEVREVLDTNMAERNSRGGKAVQRRIKERQKK